MEFLANLDEPTLHLLHKCTTQLSTALRTFSKLVLSLQKTGDKKSTPRTPEITCPVLKETAKIREKGQLVQWIFSKKCGWRLCHGKDVAKWVQNEKYRADRCGSTWKLIGPNPEHRASWRKIPNSEVKTLYATYTDTLEESKELVENPQPGWLERIRPSKAARHKNILNSTQMSEREFVKLMKELHNKLPPLRGFIKIV